MCAAPAMAYGASQSQLPVSTPVTAALEQAGGGRSIKENFKQNTGLGKVMYPPKAPAYKSRASPKAGAKAKKSLSKKVLKTTGGGLRINNRKLNTGLQLK